MSNQVKEVSYFDLQVGMVIVGVLQNGRMIPIAPVYVYGVDITGGHNDKTIIKVQNEAGARLRWDVQGDAFVVGTGKMIVRGQDLKVGMVITGMKTHAKDSIRPTGSYKVASIDISGSYVDHVWIEEVTSVSLTEVDGTSVISTIAPGEAFYVQEQLKRTKADDTVRIDALTSTKCTHDLYLNDALIVRCAPAHYSVNNKWSDAFTWTTELCQQIVDVLSLTINRLNEEVHQRNEKTQWLSPLR